MNAYARAGTTLLGAALTLLMVPASAGAAPATGPRPADVPADPQPAVLPTTIALPDGFPPEGIATGPGPFAYLGNRVDGAIYRANLLTGTGSIISPATGTPSLGMKTDPRGRLFVAGGSAGDARVVDTRTGAVIASYQLATGSDTFVNDVVLTPHAAYLTDSLSPVLYELPLGRDGAPPQPGQVRRIPLSGAIEYQEGFNANGITRTPDGRGLLIVQSNTGLLFRVDPRTGVTSRVDLGGETLVNGDGMLLLGCTLFVVQNQFNQVAEVRIDAAGTTGTVLRRLTDPRFDVPTTVAAFAGRLYLPNARFTVEPTPTTPYAVVAVPLGHRAG